MSYAPQGPVQPGYGPAPDPGAGYVMAPPRKRGTKRIVFGILGIVGNIVGLFVMPVVATGIAVVIAGVGSMDLEPVDPRGGTFTADSFGVYGIAVPADLADEARCSAQGEDIRVDPAGDDYSPGSVDGVRYVEVMEVQATGEQQVTVTCEGTDRAAVSTFGVGGALFALGIGVVLPVLLGIAALALLVWGIVARMRS